MKNASYYIRITCSLLAICAVVACLLAAVNIFTRDIIAANAQKEREKAVADIYPAMTSMKAQENDWLDGVNNVYAIYDNEAWIGYAVDLDSRGFGGVINMIVGIGTDGTVAGVRVISHSETPGLGSKATLADYLKNYVGVGEQLTIKQDIDAVSGATISSKAVLAGVNLALSLGLGGVSAHA